MHEGHVLAISIELSTMVTSSSWVIYNLKDYPSLADMYLLLSRKLKLVEAHCVSHVLFVCYFELDINLIINYFCACTCTVLVSCVC